MYSVIYSISFDTQYSAYLKKSRPKTLRCFHFFIFSKNFQKCPITDDPEPVTVFQNTNRNVFRVGFYRATKTSGHKSVLRLLFP